jgi:hypothetical protein
MAHGYQTSSTAGEERDMSHVTPMKQKFLDKRKDEQSIVFSHNEVRDITQVEHYGHRFYLRTPCFYCSLCGTTEVRCSCAEGA